jgi:hypothetical protein
MHGDNVAELHPEVASNHTVHAGTTIIELIVRQDDENSITPLLSLHEYGVAAEELKSLHGVVGEGNDRVIIVNCISDTVENKHL